MRFRFVVVVILAALAAPPAFSGFAGTDLFIPMAGRGTGVYPSNWFTTLWIYNPNGAAVAVDVSFLERQKNNVATPPPKVTVVLAAGETKLFENIVEDTFGKTVYGALRVECSEKVVASARVFSKESAGAPLNQSFGQDFAGVPASLAIGIGESADILGGYQTQPDATSEARFNIGCVETSGSQTTVRWTARDELGVPQGTFDKVVPPLSQVQGAFKDYFPGVSLTNSRLTVEVIAGSGEVVCYGSMITNDTTMPKPVQDPTTFEMTYKQGLVGVDTVLHDATLVGDGTVGAPLGLKIPVDVSSSTAFQPTIKATFGGAEAAAVEGVCTNGCTGLEGRHTPSGNYAYIGWQNGGVFGVGSATKGVHGDSNTGYGVYGTAESGTGVAGFHNAASGTNPGVLGETKSTSANAIGVYGLVSSTSPGGSSAAVRGENRGTGGTGIGVYGSQDGSGWGVYGRAESGRGVYGYSPSGNGVYALGAGAARDDAALRAHNSTAAGGMAAYLTNGSNFATAHFRNSGSGEVLYLQANGGLFIKAVNNAENDAEFTVDYNGNVRADGTFASPAADFAELLPSCGGLEPGDLVAIGPDGTLIPTDTPMQTNVAGIYSTKPAFLGGDGRAGGGERIPLAIVGIVPVKASAENGAIRPGDLLVAAATPGHAMRCGDSALCGGAVVGKALSGLESGAGTVTTLVSLH
jgi:hypothetical protein